MKTKIIILTAITFIVAGMLGQAQPGVRFNKQAPHGQYLQKQNPGHWNFLNLTEEQQNQMKQLRVEHQKEVKPLVNQMRENRAHYKTLLSTDQPEEKTINKSIDEFTGLQNKLQKSKVNFQLKMREILTDDQKQKIDEQKFRVRQGRMHKNGISGHGRNMRGRTGQMGKGFCPVRGVE